MDNDHFKNAGIPPPGPLQFEAAMPIPWSGLNRYTSEQSFSNPNPNSTVDQYSQFDSSLSSLVTSSAAALPSDEILFQRELIGKLGRTGNSAAFPSPATTVVAAGHCAGTVNQMDVPSLGNSGPFPPPPSLPPLAADPGFVERAAKFSCFGSRSFNGRASPLGLNNAGLGHRSSTPLMRNGKLPRVSSSPSLELGGSPVQNKNLGIAQMEMRTAAANGMGDNKLSKLSGSGANSNESSVSEQIPTGETGSKTSNELNSRKRKGVCRGKSKEERSTLIKGDDGGNAKRSKPTECGKNETNTEGEAKGGSNDEKEKQKADKKPPEPPKDYIHVRARRGQATDSHSLAERVRREKISERMKLLQDLVPGCTKVTGKALMLDEIINYVQSLQRQVEFLSMKLASVNPGLDFNMENLLSKDMFQQNTTTLPQQMYPLDSPAPALYHPQSQQNVQQLHDSISRGPLSQCSADPLPLDAPLCRSLGIHLPPVDGFSGNLPQFPAFSEDDLHSIVQMGFVQNPVNFPVQNQTSNMKTER